MSSAAGRQRLEEERKRAQHQAMLAEVGSDSDEEGTISRLDPPATRVPTPGARAARAPARAAEDKAESKTAGAAMVSPAPVIAPAGMDSLRAFLMSPLREGAPPVECFVIRNKSGLNRFSPVYMVHLEAGSRFIMSAKKRSKNRTSNFLIAMDARPCDRASENVLGKLRSDFVGSEYTIFDRGLNPAKTAVETQARRELGVIMFEYDKMGPGHIQAAVPGFSRTGAPFVWKPKSDEEKISAALRSGRHERLFLLENKRPKWDEAAGGHVLNFRGRVTVSSVKNFQLASQATGDATVLQFGRVGKDKFTMDVQYPLSLYQGLAICLASLDRKMADSKGFDMFKRLRK